MDSEGQSMIEEGVPQSLWLWLRALRTLYLAHAGRNEKAAGCSTIDEFGGRICPLRTFGFPARHEIFAARGAANPLII